MTDELRHVEPVMGTRVTLAVRHDGAPFSAVEAAMADAVEALHAADRKFSLYRPDSALSRLRAGTLDATDAPPSLRMVLDIAAECTRCTGGGFDLHWREDGPDPTGLVKGWAAEQASAALSRHGFGDHLVNAAGDVRVRGRRRPWFVAIADPFRPDGFAAVLNSTNLAVATSGTAEQGLHIIDPRTGAPATHLVSATVIGGDLTRADAYATAAVALGRDARPLLLDLDAVGWPSLTIAATGEVWASPSFPGPGPGSWPNLYRSTRCPGDPAGRTAQ